jgi:glycosyltransferase involved in cell wall biosynthesis
VTSYPPPRAGWGIRVEFLKKALEREGHQCVVLNIGTSRLIPSPEYETVLGAGDFVKKVWRYSRQGYLVHAHANGDAIKGALLALLSEVINLACGRRCVLTFHAGVIQRYFPPDRAARFVPLFWLLFTIPRRIICNSAAVKAKIEAYGIPSAKIVAIPAFSKQYMEFAPAALPEPLTAFFQRYPHVIFTYARMRPLFYPLTLIDGFAAVVQRRPDAGLVLCGVSGHMEQDLWSSVQDRIRQHGLEDHICVLEDLDHDAFLTALSRSTLYLRTPITDGVASSVLESLALGVPVVACDNGTRPTGVLTYPVEDHEQMASQVEHVIAHREDVVRAMGELSVADTIPDEIAVLVAG